ncbi:MAG: hypothetical protein RR676_03280, partial [Acinetobacter sp.]
VALKRLAAPRRVFILGITTSFEHLFGTSAPLQKRPAGKGASILKHLCLKQKQRCLNIPIDYLLGLVLF